MRLDKTTNVKRGIRYGLIYKLVTLILPFFVQTIMIRKLGIEYAGIKGVFTSILTVLNLAELGIGSAIVYNMYKPIAENDFSGICALLNAYRSIYRVIGIIILCFGLLITPFLELLIHDEYPQDINLQVVFLLYLANTVVSYFLYAYKVSLLSAYQRNDIISIIGTAVQAALYIAQIIILIVAKNFYLYLGIAIVFTLINNLVTSVCVDKMFPEIKCNGNIDKMQIENLKKNVAGVLVYRICGTTRNTFDSIFISVFLNLTQAAIYSNYLYIMTAINSIMGIVNSSLLSGVGNSIALDSKEHNFNQMIKLNTAYLCVSGWVAVCMLCLYQPFMKLWVGEEFLYPSYVVFLFPLYFYMQKLGDIRSVYSDAAGLFWQNRIRNILESLSNIILNYLFVKLWGVFGVLLATVITIFVFGFFSSAVVVFKHYFEKGFWKYIGNCMFFLVVTIIVGILSFTLCNIWGGVVDNIILTLVLRGAICITIVPFVYYLFVSWRTDFKESLHMIKKSIRNR